MRKFRQFSDISYASLCIVGRNCNKRRLLGFIDQSLTVAIVLRTERSGVRISPGAPYKSKSYGMIGVALFAVLTS